MELRLWLDANQYRIDREELVVDRDRIYVIIRAVTRRNRSSQIASSPGHEPDRGLSLGPVLLQEKPPLFGSYLHQVARHVQFASRRMPELSEVMAAIQEWLDPCLEATKTREAHHDS